MSSMSSHCEKTKHLSNGLGRSRKKMGAGVEGRGSERQFAIALQKNRNYGVLARALPKTYETHYVQ